MRYANVNNVMRHNPNINSCKIEVCLNSIEMTNKNVGFETRNQIKVKYCKWFREYKKRLI